MAYDTFLSQNEVDSLFAEIEGTPTPKTIQEEPVYPDGVRPYDLSSPERIVRKRMQTFELINERFARNLRAVLLSFMRRNADVSVLPIKIQTFSEFERNLPVPSNLNMVKLSPLRGMSLFCFDPTLVFLVIETLFGGQIQQNTRVEGRDFTATEQRIIQRLLTHTLESYAHSWKPVYPIEYRYLRSEMHTKFANITGANEIVVVTPIRIEFGTMGGLLNVCLPYSMIEPLRDLLTQPFQDETEKGIENKWLRQLAGQLPEAEVELVANFTTIETSVAELLDLQEGMVLPIELPAEVTATIENVPVLKAKYGISNKHYALSVIEHLEVPSFDIPEHPPIVVPDISIDEEIDLDDEDSNVSQTSR